MLAGLQTAKVNQNHATDERLQEDRACPLAPIGRLQKSRLQDAIDGLLAGDVDTGKALLRDYINRTTGFERLGELAHIPAKSLMRMLGPKGTPHTNISQTSTYLAVTDAGSHEAMAKFDQARGLVPAAPAVTAADQVPTGHLGANDAPGRSEGNLAKNLQRKVGKWSGRLDSNQRHLAPKASALPG